MRKLLLSLLILFSYVSPISAYAATPAGKNADTGETVNATSNVSVTKGRDRNVTVCVGPDGPSQVCKVGAIPKILGVIRSIDVSTPIPGAFASWVVNSTKSEAICAMKASSTAISCVQLKASSEIETKLAGLGPRAVARLGQDEFKKMFLENADTRRKELISAQAKLAHIFSIGNSASTTQYSLSGSGCYDINEGCSTTTGPDDGGDIGDGPTWDDSGSGGISDSGGYDPFEPPKIDPVCAARAQKFLDNTIKICNTIPDETARRDCINGAQAAYLDYWAYYCVIK